MANGTYLNYDDSLSTTKKQYGQCFNKLQTTSNNKKVETFTNYKGSTRFEFIEGFRY
jgi:hypothetical protein